MEFSTNKHIDDEYFIHLFEVFNLINRPRMIRLKQESETYLNLYEQLSRTYPNNSEPHITN
jgi:hypothetical protein